MGVHSLHDSSAGDNHSSARRFLMILSCLVSHDPQQVRPRMIGLRDCSRMQGHSHKGGLQSVFGVVLIARQGLGEAHGPGADEDRTSSPERSFPRAAPMPRATPDPLRKMGLFESVQAVSREGKLLPYIEQNSAEEDLLSIGFHRMSRNLPNCFHQWWNS